MRTFDGFWPALITPYTPDDQINLPVLLSLVDYHLAKGVSGFYLCGSTGEGLFLRTDERILIVDEVIKRVQNRVPIIVQVGASSINEATQLAAHAQSAGAAAISSIIPPIVYDARGIVPFFTRLAAAAPNLPFLPYLFGYTRDAVALMHDLAAIPTLAGTKYTAPNMYEMNQIIGFRKEGWTVFSGMDEQAVLGVQFGASGLIGSTLNFMPGVYREIIAGVRGGKIEHALELQRRANAVTTLLISNGFAGAFRETMHVIGFDCGAPRLPNLPLPGEKRAALRAALDELDFASLAAL